jgi:hypothetical protein
MQKEFIEAVFEGDYHTIRGYIEGFVAARGKESCYYVCTDCGVEPETLSEHIREWISLGGKLHHLLIESELFNEIRAALMAADKKAILCSSAIKSNKNVRGANFHFRFEAYGKKYAHEIKAILERLPERMVLTDYNPVEKIDEECKGVELYTVCHDYEFKGEGTLSGPVEQVIALREALDAHPLVEAGKVKLDL